MDCDLCGGPANHAIFLKGALTVCLACYQGMAKIERHSVRSDFDRWVLARLMPAAPKAAAA